MEVVHVGPWTIEVDVEATRSEVYAPAIGGSEECGCADCRNFIAARETTYSPGVRQLLESLGIDIAKELEAYSAGPDLESGGLIYGGWFPLVGRVIEGPDPYTRRSLFGSVIRLYEHEVVPGFSVSVIRDVSGPAGPRVREVAKQRPVATIEFTARVPWLLDEPMDPHWREAFEEFRSGRPGGSQDS